MNRSSLQQRSSEPALSPASAPPQRSRNDYRDKNSMNFRVQECHVSTDVCYKCGNVGHISRESPKNRQGNGNGGNRTQYSLMTSVDRVAPRGATLGTYGATNRLYTITSRQEQENLPDVITGIIKVFTFDVYALLDLERVYRDCTIYVNHKETMADLVELDMVDFDVIIEWRSSSTVPKCHFISYLNARKLVSG
ncbi:hypothetical protein H5410_021500, partial [Solanum commersonii]